MNRAVEAAAEILRRFDTGGDVNSARRKVADYSLEELESDLETEEARKAFWINLYNAESQILASRHRVLHSTKLLFLLPLSSVAGTRISLNGVENGMLRSGMTSLGFEKPGLLTRRLESRLRLEEVDPRIHFALNCASVSCPPVRYYTAENIEGELDRATRSFLSQEVSVGESTIELPRIFKWFSVDFGGEKGVKAFLKNYTEVVMERKELSYRGFDWTRQISVPED